MFISIKKNDYPQHAIRKTQYEIRTPYQGDFAEMSSEKIKPIKANFPRLLFVGTIGKKMPQNCILYLLTWYLLRYVFQILSCDQYRLDIFRLIDPAV